MVVALMEYLSHTAPLLMIHAITPDWNISLAPKRCASCLSPDATQCARLAKVADRVHVWVVKLGIRD
jgi:hypothetical protein